ncbi:MAG: TRAP transporter TatT component family protein [Thioalkalispiraceae bacterium]|jgi:hypothetical protein
MDERMQDKATKLPSLIVLLLAFFWLSGCSSIINSATSKMAKNLTISIQNHDDPDTVASAIPAYLLMIDSFIQGDPENRQMLQSGAKLYAAFASTFVNDEQRAKKLSERALGYALRASCIQHSDLCQVKTMPFNEYQQAIQRLDKDSIDMLFALGQSWAVWLKAHRDDWNAVAELPRIRLIVEKILQLDENYQQGSAHLYMGILHSLLPASLGGKPEIAKQHFEKAIAISNNTNLMAKVSYAENYARLVFDRQLHDKLLTEVINAKAEQPGMTLMNSLAQQKAKRLLESGKDYF